MTKKDFEFIAEQLVQSEPTKPELLGIPTVVRRERAMQRYDVAYAAWTEVVHQFQTSLRNRFMGFDTDKFYRAIYDRRTK